MNKIGVLRFANHCVVFLHIFYNILQKFDCNYYLVINNDDVLVYLFSLRIIFKVFIGFYFLKQLISDLFQPLPSFFHLLSAVSLIFTSVSFRAPTDAPKCELLFGFPKTSRSSSPSSYSVSSTRDRTHGFSTSPRMYSKTCHKM